ncbi:MAG: SMC family ATPase [Dehalococcoidia bacterium]|nr:SMC family ATPase [Dehalococcoidia bacterium]
MIPLTLRVRNFLPYKGEVPPLSFASIHTACISGDNGAGKSSVIDAITWALWGKSRAKSDDDLIYQSENETEVEFDFCTEGQLYRIVRRHARPKGRRTSGQSSLDLFVHKDDDFLPLTAERMRQTEDKIKSILHMDYDIFINSAYLRQGHADEFTRQDPAKRKEVLANILGLEIYDGYEERAKEKCKEAQQKKINISASISETEEKLAQQPALEADLAQAAEQHTAISTGMSTTEGRLKQLRQEDVLHSAVKARLEQLDTTIKRNHEELKRKTAQYKDTQQHIGEHEALLAHRSDIEAAYQQLQETREQYEKMNLQLQQIVRLREECKPYEEFCSKHENQLISERDIIQSSFSQLKMKAEQLAALNAEQQELHQKKQVLLQAEKEFERSRKSLNELETAHSRIEDANKRLSQDIVEIEEKQLMLTGTKQETTCPLCESDLSGGQLELVQKKYSSDKAAKLNEISENNKAAAGLGAQLKSDKDALRRQEENFKSDTDALTRQEERLAQALNESDAAARKIELVTAQLEEVTRKLSTHDYAHTEREALSRIKSEIGVIAYNEKRHGELLQEKQRLQGSEKQKRELDDASILLQKEQESASGLTEEINTIQAQLLQDGQTHLQLSQQLEKWGELQQELQQTENSLQQQTKEQQTALKKMTVLKEKLTQLSEMETQSAEKRGEMALAAESESLYKQLSQAFGKKGIQAMLIETALPEIEAEANHLLSRMTDGRMTLTFETQQATKIGTLSETLDIKIADELGTRNYEMFSGGEGFRIDFAVRIALSKLLARRAGAPMPTLIIDEGFGTQDTDGIEKLKESINSIQDDFQKILVITHIDELKDAFPVRINVVKATEGSRIEIS